MYNMCTNYVYICVRRHTDRVHNFDIGVCMYVAIHMSKYESN